MYAMRIFWIICGFSIQIDAMGRFDAGVGLSPLFARHGGERSPAALRKFADSCGSIIVLLQKVIIVLLRRVAINSDEVENLVYSSRTGLIISLIRKE